MKKEIQESVTLVWVQKLSFKAQSVLFSGLRGTDTHHTPNLKALVRWLRPVTQSNADYSTDYMREEPFPVWDDVKKELEFVTVHYYAHLMHAIQIVAYHHPEELIRLKAFSFYINMAEHLHLNQESREQMGARLR